VLTLAIVPDSPAFGQTVTYRLHGLSFGPYIDGQDPNTNPQISFAQLQSRVQPIAPYTLWLRSYGITNGLENLPMIARSFGLQVAAGAWIGANQTSNNLEISNLISACNAGRVDLAIVGSEALRRGDVTEMQLIGYINQVRQAIPANIPVATADTADVLLNHPAVMAAGSVVLANIYPYWQGVAIENAICSLIASYQRLVAGAGGKQVIISETGWPSAGNVVGAAVPSPANANRYFMEFVSWARANDVPYYYFEALDEPFKARYEGPQGAHWGLWDMTMTLKPGMQPVFDGQVVSNACLSKIGAFRAGVWFLDMNGNSVWDVGDRAFSWGLSSSVPVVGDWNGDGHSKAGIFENGTWYLDYNGDGVFNAGDRIISWGQAGDVPVVGDWNGDKRTKIGVYRNGTWLIDFVGNGDFNGRLTVSWGDGGSVPVVGDWNGNGRSKIGVYKQGVWYLDVNGNFVFDAGDRVFAWGTSTSVPVTGDWNGTATTKIGVYDQGLWALDINGSGVFDAGDRIFIWGTSAAKPVVGDWSGDGKDKIGVFLQGNWYLDMNGDFAFNAGDRAFTWGATGDQPLIGRW
jgi:exo-beta-1,3-glucanase (GH17 family)